MTAPAAVPQPGDPPARGQPGDGCQDPRDLHRHRCATCGFELTFSAAKCRSLPIVPHCEMCGATEWRYEIDYLDGAP